MKRLENGVRQAWSCRKDKWSNILETHRISLDAIAMAAGRPLANRTSTPCKGHRFSDPSPGILGHPLRIAFGGKLRIRHGLLWLTLTLSPGAVAWGSCPSHFVSEWDTPPQTELQNPFRIAINSIGNVLVAMLEAPAEIREYTPDGELIRSFGEFGHGPGQLTSAFALAVALDGSVYALDPYLNKVLRYDAQGNFLGEWGSFGDEDGQFEGPHGLAVDANGVVYVADSESGRVQSFTAEGSHLLTWRFCGGDPRCGVFPYEMAASASGHLYVLDVRGWIHKYTNNGLQVTSWEAGSPFGLGIDPAGDVFHANFDQVQLFSPNGELLCRWGVEGSEAHEFSWAIDVAVDSDGFAYVVDFHQRSVKKFAPPTVDAKPSTWGRLKAIYR